MIKNIFKNLEKKCYNSFTEKFCFKDKGDSSLSAILKIFAEDI